MTLVQKLQGLVSRAPPEWSGELSQIGVTPELRAGLQRGDLSGWTVSLAARVARLLGFDDSVLWDEEPLPTIEIRGFRGQQRVVGASDLRALQGVHSLLCALRLPLPDTTRSVPKDSPRRPVYQQGYDLARWLRKGRGCPDAPLPRLVELVEALGIPVLWISLESSDLLGVTVLSSQGVAILLHDRLRSSPAILRRTLAHELCHACFDPIPEGGAFQVEFDGDEEDLFERRARAFAAELLVPHMALKDAHAQTPEQARALTLRFAAEFGAPPELTANHLVNGKVFEESLKPDVKRERLPISGEPSGQLLWSRIRGAVERDELGRGRARELLSLLEGVAGAADALAT